MPIEQRLREQIRVYNTCAGYSYNQAGGSRRLVSADSGDESAAGPYEDQIAFIRRPAELLTREATQQLVDRTV